jgi:hypothetical protein
MNERQADTGATAPQMPIKSIHKKTRTKDFVTRECLEGLLPLPVGIEGIFPIATEDADLSMATPLFYVVVLQAGGDPQWEQGRAANSYAQREKSSCSASMNVRHPSNTSRIEQRGSALPLAWYHLSLLEPMD